MFCIVYNIRLSQVISGAVSTNGVIYIVVMVYVTEYVLSLMLYLMCAVVNINTL